MNTKIVGLLAAGLLVGPMAAEAQAVTYYFTGVVTSSNDSAAGVGTKVTGDYTFNFAAANPDSQPTSPSGTAPWIIYNDGQEGSPEANNIFSTTATAGSLSYSSGETPGYIPGAGELGGYGGAGPGYFYMSETDYPVVCSAPGACGYVEMSSSMGITDPGHQMPYTVAGLPILSWDSVATGTFTNAYGDTVDYRITSLVAAPELDCSRMAAALTLLIGGVLVLKGRGRLNQTKAAGAMARLD
jgi:hypothetical protein